MQKILYSISLALSVILSACSAIDDPNSGSSIVPIITLDSQSSVYTTKVGREITVSPSYQYLDATSEFFWTLDGETIAEDSTLTFSSEEAGQFYILLRVTNSAGDDEVELRVDVADISIPSISLPGIESTQKIAQGLSLSLTPVVTSALPLSYSWTQNGSEISTDKDIVFSGESIGAFAMVFTASNEDGEASVDFVIEVCDKDEIGFSWEKGQSEYNASKGRTIRIGMVNIAGEQADAKYNWLKDGEVIETTSVPTLSYKGESEGRDTIVVQTSPNSVLVSDTLFVNVCPEEGEYYRPSSASSSSEFTEVLEYRPAPGQFINDKGVNLGSMAEACSYAKENMEAGGYVSLGGFGGYIVVGFDHSIDAKNGYSLAIKGNSFTGSSEPGVVWVMQDENGDGLPNDTWYELAGSEYGKAQTVQEYEITYFRPSAPRQPVAWTDNLGQSGTMNRNATHSQDYYYPNWIAEDSYTLCGTRLEPRAEDTSGNGMNWVMHPYEWGYVDNFSEVDRLTDSDNAAANSQNNHFNLTNAVRFDGEKAELKYIDFVKVQCAVNFQCGWLGEVSTEVFGFSDFNLTQQTEQ